MYSRLLKESFRRQRQDKWLAIGVMSFSAAILATLLTLTLNIGDQMARELKSYGANLELLPQGATATLNIGGKDYNPLRESSFLAEADLPQVKEIYWRNNIRHFAPWLETRATLNAGDRKLEGVALIGTWFDRPFPLADEPEYRTGIIGVNPFWRVDGQWPHQAQIPPDATACLVGSSLAEQLDLRLHQTLLLKHEHRVTSFFISGILHTGGSEDQAILADLQSIQQLSDRPGLISKVQISALAAPEDDLSRAARQEPDSLDAAAWDLWYCTAYVSSIAHQLEAIFPNATSRPVWQVVSNEGVVIEKIQTLLFTFALVAALAATMGIAAFMSLSILKSARQIGLMKSIGASSRDVYQIFMGEAALVGLAGGLIGCIGGALFAQILSWHIFHSFAGQPLFVPPLVLLFSISTATLGSWFPARMITRIDPAKVLHGRA